MHTTLHHNIAFRRLSPGARLVFYVALEIAGDLNQGGALSVRGVGPLTVAEIAIEVGVTEAHAKKGLADLVNIGFLNVEKRGDVDCYVIDKWEEKTGAVDTTAAERKRRSREKSRNRSRVTPGVTSQDESRVHTRSREEEAEGEVDSVPTGTGGSTSPPPWTEEVTEAVRAIKTHELRSLNADERFTLARYHAFRFAGCTRNEATNRRKAIGIATGIQNLTDRISRDPAKADLTVDEYVAAGVRLFERAGALLHNAMDLLPEIEIIEAVPA